MKVGVFWRRTTGKWFTARWDVWLCLLPTLPIHLTWTRPRAAGAKKEEVAAR